MTDEKRLNTATTAVLLVIADLRDVDDELVHDIKEDLWRSFHAISCLRRFLPKPEEDQAHVCVDDIPY